MSLVAADPEPPGQAKATDVSVPPLLVYAAFMAAAFGVDVLLPLRFPATPTLRGAGYLMVAAGIVLIIWAILTFVLARVIPLPGLPPGRLIVGGPLALSRNPIYLGGTLAFLGTGLIGGWMWVLIWAVPLMLVVRYIVAREERFLRDKFPDEYPAYAARVRRWI